MEKEIEKKKKEWFFFKIYEIKYSNGIIIINIIKL